MVAELTEAVMAITAQLTEGKIYTIKVTAFNLSKRAGVPVAATLTISTVAMVDSQTILEDWKVYTFAAEEIHTFDFSMAVPMGTGGKAGVVVATVLDPLGNKLADFSLDIDVQAVVVPVFNFSRPIVTITTHIFATAWKVAEVSCVVSNPTPITITRSIRCCWSYEDSPGSLACNRNWGEEGVYTFELTLSPGQSYSLISPAYWYYRGETFSNSPNIGKGKKFWYCFRDDLGNKSEQVLA